MKRKYNGKTLQEIEARIPSHWAKAHKQEYLKNCKDVIQYESEGHNLDLCQQIRNSNHAITVFYLTLG